MTDYEKAVSLIALAELTYMDQYYGEDIKFFDRNKITSSSNTIEQSNIPARGE